VTVPKIISTLPENITDICERISIEPLISPSDVIPSDPRLEVIGVLNPAFFLINGKPSLVVRIDERPLLNKSNVQIHSSEFKFIEVAYLKFNQTDFLGICQVKVPASYNPYNESVLPELVRQNSNGNGASSPDLLLSFISHLRIAEIHEDTILIDKTPTIFPFNRFSQFGCEDPRATNIEGNHLITFNAIGKFGGTAWLASVSSTNKTKTKWMLLGPDHKHCALFPIRIDDKYLMLTRPLTRATVSCEGIWLTNSPDLEYWNSPTPLLLPRRGMWDSIRVGPAASPIMLPEGWLLLYYGVDNTYSYHLGAALLNSNNPLRVMARASAPILSPILEWERNGRRADTVFPCGAQFLPNSNKIRIYYGAADMYVGAADLNVPSLMAELKEIT
jgi:predicted GH43/DUF377 family glycosyl hydrolase